MKLAVFITLPHGEQVKVGVLDFGEVLSGRRYKTSFLYADRWLEHPAFFPIDPESLNPRTNKAKNKTRFEANALNPPLSVFHDSLPDDWGRRLLIAAKKLDGIKQENPYLLKEIGATSLGALSFFDPAQKPVAKTIRSESVVDLNDLIAAAARFEAGDKKMSAAFLRLFNSGGTPGGARPKVLATSGTSEEGREWIAKFPSKAKDNGIDVVGLEGTCMAVAEQAGLHVAKTEVRPFPNGNVLLVERFDINPQVGRNHMISLRTLCKEAPGIYALRYKELADKIRTHSCQPEIDVPMFFRQMVFNAVIGNTDDHLKNFAMIRDEEGYKLSKAFDLVPDIAEKKEHTLFFNLNPFTNGTELVEIGKSWAIDSPGAIVLHVCQAAKQFRATAKKIGVDKTNLDKFSSEIERRLREFERPLLSRQKTSQ